jgi:hypothetical protein
VPGEDAQQVAEQVDEHECHPREGEHEASRLDHDSRLASGARLRTGLRVSVPIVAEVLIWAYLAVIVARSVVHTVAPDGGAESIAAIDTSVDGGSNIIAVEPLLRFIAGTLKPVETMGTAPGAALNELMGLVMLIALYLALCSGMPRVQREPRLVARAVGPRKAILLVEATGHR